MIIINRSEDVEKALRLVLERLRKNDKEDNDYKEPKHICTNCKYRNMKEGYDQQWGRFFIVENWCGKDRKLMNSFLSHGNSKHFSEPCNHFVTGDGVYHKMSKRKKRKLGIG